MNARSSALLLILAVSAIAACSKNDSVSLLPQLEEDRDANSRLMDKAKQRAAGLREEVKQIREELIALRSDTEQSLDLVRKAVAEKQSLQYAQAQFQERYLESVQKRAPGMLLGDITINNHSYLNARVKSLDAWDVSIIHTEGVSKLAMSDLSPDLQAKLGYNPNAGPKKPAVAPPGAAPGANTAATSGTAGNTGAVSGTAPPATMPGPRLGDLKPGTVLYEGGGISSSGKRLNRVVIGDDGRPSEVVGNYGPGGTTSGSKIQGAGSTLPPGYKPVGSGYSGSALDREYQQKKAAGKP